MANNLIQIKRTSVAGRAANTTHIPNAGEVAINMTDQIMYSTNGEYIFEIGANIGTQVVRTALYVGDNVDITGDTLFIGNTSVNLSVNSSSIKIANATQNTGITIPTSTEYAGEYYLHANGLWAEVPGADPGGGNTQIQYNDSSQWGGSAGFTFNETTNNVLIANTLTIGTATINSTNYSQTANNANYLGGTAAADYQTEAGLAANVATMDANNAAYLGGTAAASYALDSDLDAYQTEAGLSDNVATLAANNASYLGGLAAANYANLSSATFTVQAAVGANVVANLTSVLVGNSTYYVNVTSQAIKLANATVNTALTVPSAAEYAGAYYLHANGSWHQISSAAAQIGFTFDGGGQAIATGEYGYQTIPFDCTINEYKLLADQTGSIVIDIWKAAYADFPPVVANTITASAKPTLSNQNKYSNNTLSGWTTSISAGDVLRYKVESVTSVTNVTLTLNVAKV